MIVSQRLVSFYFDYFVTNPDFLSIYIYRSFFGAVLLEVPRTIPITFPLSLNFRDFPQNLTWELCLDRGWRCIRLRSFRVRREGLEAFLFSSNWGDQISINHQQRKECSLLKDVIGANGIIFLSIRNAPKNEGGYAELSFQDITDRVGCLHLDRVKQTLGRLLKAGVIERISRGAPYKNQWRVAPTAHELLDNLTKQKT